MAFGQARLAGLYDGMSGVVAKTGHQCHRNMSHQFLQPQHQLVARVVRQLDIGDDYMVRLFQAVPHHGYGLIPFMRCFNSAAIAFQQRMGIIADGFVGIDHKDSFADQFRIMFALAAH